MEEKIAIAKTFDICDGSLDLGAIRDEYERFAERIRPMVCDTAALLNNAIREVRRFLESDSTLQKVLFVCFDSESYNLYGDLLAG